jgi:hypothetical protein
MIGNMKTPETDALYERLLAENPGNLIYLEEMLELACRLERERASAIKKIQRQAERICQLEGATNHAGGTPLSIALRERDEARADAAALADKLSGLELRSTEELARLEQERNEAREERDNLKQELEIVTARFHGKKHPLDNGIPERREIYIWKNGKYELDP